LPAWAAASRRTRAALLFLTAAFDLIARMGRRFAAHTGGAAFSHRRLQPEA
jgi:hypothetical protein